MWRPDPEVEKLCLTCKEGQNPPTRAQEVCARARVCVSDTVSFVNFLRVGVQSDYQSCCPGVRACASQQELRVCVQVCEQTCVMTGHPA